MARSKAATGKSSLRRELSSLRGYVQLIDKEIINLISARQELTDTLGLVKAAANLPIRNKRLEQKFYTVRKTWAKRSKVDQKLVREIFELVLLSSVARQAKARRR